jgi:glycosyltransferase involved in cell wall biosynthesis
LIDDSSTDDSTQIALKYTEQHPEKVRYSEHRGHENQSMSALRNLGISHAKGEYIAFLDSDDVWLPHKLQQQASILYTHLEASAVYGISEEY